MCVIFQYYRGYYIQPAGWKSECIISRITPTFLGNLSKNGSWVWEWPTRKQVRIFIGVGRAKRYIDKTLHQGVY